MASSRRKSLRERFPKQWSAKATFYTPKGSMIEVDGPYDDEVGRLALHLMCMGANPEVREKLKNFYDELVVLTNGKSSKIQDLAQPEA